MGGISTINLMSGLWHCYTHIAIQKHTKHGTTWKHMPYSSRKSYFWASKRCPEVGHVGHEKTQGLKNQNNTHVTTAVSIWLNIGSILNLRTHWSSIIGSTHNLSCQILSNLIIFHGEPVKFTTFRGEIPWRTVIFLGSQEGQKRLIVLDGLQKSFREIFHEPEAAVLGCWCLALDILLPCVIHSTSTSSEWRLKPRSFVVLWWLQTTLFCHSSPTKRSNQQLVGGWPTPLKNISC